MKNLFNGIYRNKTVLVTGHTGFKGSWLSFWLEQMGANVIGYSLEPVKGENHFNSLNLNITSIIADIRDRVKLDEIFTRYQPDIVFHLAAQPLVKASYKDPIDTFEINVMGTINIYDTVRKHSCVKAVINITSDKAYENKEWIWGYRENDPMGGYDPYSASKGCSELITASYRKSFFNKNTYKKTHNTLISSCRAGNVIGGGDWAKDRLIPDIIKSILNKEQVIIRNPNATRPWQHVLEPLSGYLCIGRNLLQEKLLFAEAWNFGPNDDANITVEEVVKHTKKYWDSINYKIERDSNSVHEANLLKLDCSKANNLLKWQNVWNSEKTFEKTITWYKTYYKNNIILTKKDLNTYIQDAKIKGLEWTN